MQSTQPLARAGPLCRAGLELFEQVMLLQIWA